MKKLELKHLAPYLPYKLKYKSLFNGSINNLYDLSTDINDNYWGVKIKPILRPLSDLELDEFKNKIFNIEYIIDKETDADLGYYEWCFLFENHFDVFGLIEKGLAININTI
jgi:hypothetical protein